MCFYKKVRTFKDIQGITPKKEKICWKIFAEEDGTLYDPYKNTEYQVDRLYGVNRLAPTILDFRVSIYLEVQIGFHGFATKKAAIEHLEFYREDFPTSTLVVRKCMIPIGASYYTNEDKQLVTTHIKVLHK